MRALGALSEPVMAGGALRRPVSAVHHDQVIGAAQVARDVRIPVDSTLRQGNAPSCTGFGFGQMIDGTAMMAGYKDQVRSSRRGIYTGGRMVQQPTRDLDNQGAIPSYVADFLVKHGVPAETDPGMFYTDDDAALRRRIPLFDLIQARRYKIESIAVVDGEGPARVEAVYRALSAGLVPAFAMTVDQAYMDLGPDDVYSIPSGKSFGGHMQAFCGFRADGCLEIVGSWDWANDGKTWITPELVGDIGVVSQIFVARVVPHMVAP